MQPRMARIGWSHKLWLKDGDKFEEATKTQDQVSLLGWPGVEKIKPLSCLLRLAQKQQVQKKQLRGSTKKIPKRERPSQAQNQSDLHDKGFLKIDILLECEFIRIRLWKHARSQEIAIAIAKLCCGLLI